MKGLKFFPILFCLKMIGLPCIKRLHKEIPIKSGDKTKVSITAVNLEINSIVRIFVRLCYKSYKKLSMSDTHHKNNVCNDIVY